MEEVHVPFSRPPTVQICGLLLTHQQVVWENKLTPSSKWHLTAQWACFLLTSLDRCVFRLLEGWTRFDRFSYLRLNGCGAWNDPLILLRGLMGCSMFALKRHAKIITDAKWIPGMQMDSASPQCGHEKTIASLRHIAVILFRDCK